MSKIVAGTALAVALIWSGAASADGAWTARIGGMYGKYETDATFTDLGCCGNPGGKASDSADDSILGVTTGTTFVFGNTFLDLGLEYAQFQDADQYYKTDALASLGFFLGERWSLFGGYRKSTRGDGFMSEEGGETQDGPFAGFGVSFTGDAMGLNLSFAYNKLDMSIDGQDVDGLDLAGVSAKAQVNFLETPHALVLRFQKFDGDYKDPGFLRYEFSDTYLTLGYQATFGLTSW